MSDRRFRSRAESEALQPGKVSKPEADEEAQIPRRAVAKTIDTKSGPERLDLATLRAWWASSWRFAATGFGAFFLLAAGGVFLAGDRGGARPAVQPIEFNHRLHVADLELECTDCHAHFETETFSGLPTAEDCAFCHEEAQGESPEEARLAQILAEGRPLEWQPLFRQPAHVFYSHRRHAAAAALECTTCHGDFSAMEKPPTRVTILDMDDCIGCHEEQQVRNDCTVCHR